MPASQHPYPMLTVLAHCDVRRCFIRKRGRQLPCDKTLKIVLRWMFT